MEEFLLFFLSIFVFFIIMNKLYKKSDVLSVRSSIDNQVYVVRKLPDAKQAADKLAMVNQNVLRLIASLSNNTRDGVDDLTRNYNPSTLSETVVGSKYTSYSLNKGEKIALCIRKKDDNLTFENENTVIFVAIHELSHIMTESVGHEKEFWDNMGFLLEKAHELDIYEPVDYNENNIDYCGMEITTTPYDFKK